MKQQVILCGTDVFWKLITEQRDFIIYRDGGFALTDTGVFFIRCNQLKPDFCSLVTSMRECSLDVTNQPVEVIDEVLEEADYSFCEQPTKLHDWCDYCKTFIGVFIQTLRRFGW